MVRQTLLFLAVSILVLNNHKTNSYKNKEILEKRYKEIEKEKFTAKDALVGRAMDFIYSNKTLMSLIARELWNFGSKAIDKIVEIKGKLPMTGYYFTA